MAVTDPEIPVSWFVWSESPEDVRVSNSLTQPGPSYGLRNGSFQYTENILKTEVIEQ